MSQSICKYKMKISSWVTNDSITCFSYLREGPNKVLIEAPTKMKIFALHVKLEWMYIRNNKVVILTWQINQEKYVSPIACAACKLPNLSPVTFMLILQIGYCSKPTDYFSHHLSKHSLSSAILIWSWKRSQLGPTGPTSP